MPRSDLNPQPRAWPRCSGCKTDYVLRRAIVFSTGKKRMTISGEWLWQRDCRHRRAQAEVAGAPRTKRTKRKAK